MPICFDNGFYNACANRYVQNTQEHLETTKKLIVETEYHRHDPKLDSFKAQLFYAKDEKGRTNLAKAKELFDKMVIRMWEIEVRKLARWVNGS